MEALHEIAPQLGMFYLVTTLLIASVIDVSTHRIPNLLLLPALVLVLLLSILQNGAIGVVISLAGLAVGFGMLLPLYIAGGTSAGDVKLLAVAGAFLGPTGAMFAGFFTFVAGAVIGIAWITWLRFRQSITYLMVTSGAGSSFVRQADVDRPIEASKHAFAYAPAIFAGVCMAAWYQGWSLPGIN